MAKTIFLYFPYIKENINNIVSWQRILIFSLQKGYGTRIYKEQVQGKQQEQVKVEVEEKQG